MIDQRSFDQHLAEDFADVTDGELSPAMMATVALCELRGWALSCPPDQTRWLVDRIDAALALVGDDALEIIRSVSGDVLDSMQDTGETPQ